MGMSRMRPKIVSRDAFIVLGVVARLARGSESPEVYAEIWRDFESMRSRIMPRIQDHSYYGVSFPADGKGWFDYMAGMVVDRDAPLPEGMEKRTVPAAEYAVFTCALSSIGETYQAIFREWQPNSSFAYDPSFPSFEQYPAEGNRDQNVRIHIPVRKYRRP